MTHHASDATGKRMCCSRMFRLCSSIFVSLAILSGSAIAQEKFLQWSDNTGRFKVDAQFVRIEGEQVVLRKLDGKDIKIPFERLSPESLELAKSKGGMSSPKAPKAPSSSPAKSNPTPSTSDAPDPTSASATNPVTKFQDNMDPKEFVDLIYQQTSKDNYIVLWDAMPASKQKQLEELMVAFANKVDTRSFDMLKRTRTSIIEILRSSKNLSSIAVHYKSRATWLHKSSPRILAWSILQTTSFPKTFSMARGCKKETCEDCSTDT